MPSTPTAATDCVTSLYRTQPQASPCSRLGGAPSPTSRMPLSAADRRSGATRGRLADRPAPEQRRGDPRLVGGRSGGSPERSAQGVEQRLLALQSDRQAQHPGQDSRVEPLLRRHVDAGIAPSTGSVVTSNKPFDRWGEVFGDEDVAAAMIDRLVRHAEVVSLRGDSYRLKDRDLGRTPTTNKRGPMTNQGVKIHLADSS